MTYRPTYLPDGRKAYNPQRSERDIMDERAEFERRLIANGMSQNQAYFTAIKWWQWEERLGERWGDWQKRVWYPRMQALAKPDTNLTTEEWAYLAELLTGANHPLGLSIYTKAMINKKR